MKIGIKVKIVNCEEANQYPDKVWTITEKPFKLDCGEEVVYLDGYDGCIKISCLEEIPNTSKDNITFSKVKYANLKEWNENKFNLKKVDRLISKYMKHHVNTKLLDIGCADGSFGKRIKDKYNFDVYGIDISDVAIDKAKKNIKAKVANLEKRLPYNDKSFEAVIMCEVIEHIFDTDFLLSEINRVLKPDSFLFITTPNIASITSRIRLLFGNYPSGLEYNVSDNTSGHIRAYTPKIIKKQLEENNFEVIKLTAPNLLFPVKNNSIPMKLRDFMVDLSDMNKNLGEQIVLVAVK